MLESFKTLDQALLGIHFKIGLHWTAPCRGSQNVTMRNVDCKACSNLCQKN